MDEVAISISRQLRARELDLPISGYRDEIHLTGALEDWLTNEGLEPWNREVFAAQEMELRFAFKKSLWTASLARSINFPEVLTVEIGVDLVSIPNPALGNLYELLQRTNNPHFTLKHSSLDELNVVISAVSHISAEPKNMQLAIGVVVNDISSAKEDLMGMLLEIPGAESLLNY